MPHKFKHPREQQHQRRLPHVKEELEAEEHEDEAGHGDDVKPRRGKQAEEAYKGVTSETRAMEGKYGRIESSPLPLQRALLTSATSRKCGPSTPVPLWKMYDIPLQHVMEPANPNANSNRGLPSMHMGSQHISVSARKLAASLWEMQGAPNYQRPKGEEKPMSHKGHTGLGKTDYHDEVKEIDPHSKGKERTSQHVNGGAIHHQHQRRHEGGRGSPKNHKLHKQQGKDAHMRSPVIPAIPQVNTNIESTSFSKTSPSRDTKAAQPEGEDGSNLSRELVKVLNQIWSLEEQRNTSTSMVASLRSELKKTKARVQELRTEQSSYQEDMEMLTQKLGNERITLQDQAQEEILAAIKPLKEELEIEKKAKLKLESKHKKLSKEMNEARKTLAKTLQEFEREQKARELMEDVCDELAREIGEDKAQVEELKRQSAKYREEVEQERQMLQMAEVWREERVHMKLAEARLELEEKNSALDKLRGELEAFLRAKRSLDEGNSASLGNVATSSDQLAFSDLHDKHSSLKQANMSAAAPANVCLSKKEGRSVVEELDDDDSFDDDLHSIELNRKSVSGSYEDPVLGHANQKVTASDKHFDHDPTHQNNLLSPSENGTNDGKQRDVSKLSLSRLSSQSGTEAMAEGNTCEIQEVDSQLIGRGRENGVIEGGRPMAWPREGLPSYIREEVKGSSSNKVKRRNESVHMGSLSKDGLRGQSVIGAAVSSFFLHGNGGTSKQQESPQDSQTARNSDGVPSYFKPPSTFPSSPTRQWAYAWPSSDPGKSHQALEDRPQAFKDTSLKARLLEAKLEARKAEKQPGLS